MPFNEPIVGNTIIVGGASTATTSGAITLNTNTWGTFTTTTAGTDLGTWTVSGDNWNCPQVVAPRQLWLFDDPEWSEDAFCK